MRVICIDDERLIMEDTVAICRELPEISEVTGFVSAKQALDWLKDHSVDIAFLDIDMPEINGLALAAKIKALSPQTAIIFVTGYSEYAIDAFRLKATGYLLKPIAKEDLASEVAYVRSIKGADQTEAIVVKTFGSFDVFKDGKPVKFKLAKCKEMLAYLVDRQGGSVTRAELSAVLWEDRPYDRKQQKLLDRYLGALKETLKEYHIEEIVETGHGTLWVVPETFECDAYRFFAGDVEAINTYRGEYMSLYSWASMTEGFLTRQKDK